MIDLTTYLKILFLRRFLILFGSSVIFYLLGQGKVGSALKKHFIKNSVPFEMFDINSKKPDGVLFLAVPDSVVEDLHYQISEKFKKVTVIHFSAGSDSESMHLLHPYCSITSDTDLKDIVFTLWTKKPEKIKKLLKSANLNYVFAGTAPSPLYHASAVISGNFTQFFILSAAELLQNEGFSEKVAERLIYQLISSSVKNTVSGVNGISGPASRGDIRTIKTEAEALAEKNKEIAEIFKKINKLIKKAVNNGTIF